MNQCCSNNKSPLLISERQPPANYKYHKDLGCVKKYTDKITWQEARNRCLMEGADLFNFGEDLEKQMNALITEEYLEFFHSSK